MNGYHYVWLSWSLAFLLAFALIYIAFPQHRRVMLRSALGTALFGLSEPLFVPQYWNPPSLFDLAERTGFDLESIVFSFSIGGIGVVLYSLLTRRVAAPVGPHGRHRFHHLALAVPVLVFVPLIGLGWNPIYPAVIAMVAGAGATMWCRPDLAAKTLVGGLLFLGFYSGFMVGLRISAPGFIEHVWNLPALSGLLLAGIPVEELLFGGAFGLYWAGLYEHLTWTRPLSTPKGERANMENTHVQMTK